MFCRPSESFDVPESALEAILADPSNPLMRIADLLPGDARVLDVGTGAGLFARVLARRGKAVTIDGIEPDPHAAERAKAHYRQLYVDSAEALLPKLAGASYDCVVMVDVLEHMRDPEAFLRGILGALPSEVRVFLSVPNVAFGGVRLALLNGHFDYVDSGLLERTHLRFFTLDTLRQLFQSVGLAIERMDRIQRSFFRTEIPARHLKVGFWTFLRTLGAEESLTYQYILVLNRRAPPAVQNDVIGVGASAVLIDYLRSKRFLRLLFGRGVRTPGASP